ncbi:MAG TPA: alpha/beta fold hydrolase [Solirubrobacterales bacterium]|nr:alpha/beta fold hydrolase [Solirubrobacterales bacterium]
MEAAAPAKPPATGSRRSKRRALWVMGHPWAERPDPTPSDGPDPYGEPDPEWLGIDWREHLRTVDLPNGTRVNYAEIGSGPTLLLVHGLGGAWQNWLENIPALARSHRVIAMDLPGFGDSPVPEWTLNIRNYGSVILDLCEALDTGTVAIVGNSMGGFVAAEVSTRNEPLVSKIALVSAAGVSHARMYRAPTATAGRMGAAMAPLLFRHHERALRRPRLRANMIRHLVYNPWLLRNEVVWEFVHTGLNAPGFADALRGLAGYDIIDKLGDVDDPTLIVWGRNDFIVPVADALAFAEMLKNSRLQIFDRTGHLPMVERPVRFNRVLEEFLAE